MTMTIAAQFGIEYSMIERCSTEPRGSPVIIVSSAIARMIPSETANVVPPSSNAAVTEPAIGTLATVATSISSRTGRVLLDTAFVDHVNCVQGSQIIRNSSTNSPKPVQPGWCTR